MTIMPHLNDVNNVDGKHNWNNEVKFNHIFLLDIMFKILAIVLLVEPH